MLNDIASLPRMQTFCNFQTCGDFDIGRMVYDEEDGLCKAFLLTGRGVEFEDVYMEGGTAPLGQKKWPDIGECFCEKHGFADRKISVHDYVSSANISPLLPPIDLDPSQKKITSFFLVKT